MESPEKMNLETENGRAETAALEQILDNLEEGILAHDLKRRILFFNREAERITGYSRQEVVGRDCHQAFGAPFCGDRCDFAGDAPGGDIERDGAISIATKGGGSRTIHMRVSSMNDGNGTRVGVLAAFREMTDPIAMRPGAGGAGGYSGIIGNHGGMLKIFHQIQNVAGYDYPVNITGETGTGKELVASAIHQESRRSGKPFVPINCGAIPEGLIESELFGHVKGSFSGAVRDKRGRFELADGGTLFLDEVSELSRPMQVKILRFLQEGTIEKVGSEKTIILDVRIISATHVDLKQAVAKKAFREDLFYRLNVIPIRIPPLRERRSDIPLLIEHFLKEASETYSHRRPRVSREALACLMDYRWPGNVRELQNAVHFAIVKCNGLEIGIDDLPMELKEQRRPAFCRGPSGKLDASQVRLALQEAGGNKSKAAVLLGVGRATLYRFLDCHPEINL